MLVALSGGHATTTKGKRTPDGYKEAQFNFPVKELVQKYLEYNKLTVVDVNPKINIDTSLSNRVKKANEAKADIYVSIHFNAFTGRWQTKAQGIETYYHHTSSNGKKLAQTIHNEVIKGTKQNDRGVKKDTVLYTNGLYELRKTNMPAILVECGFMDYKKEADLMKSIKFKTETAKEIAKGICKYFGVSYKEEKETVETKSEVKYIVQVGAFSNKENAEKLIDKLKKDNYDAILKIK